MVSRKNTGFSLLELMLTVSIGLILAGISFITFRPVLNQAHINSAYDTTLMALRNTRNLAITQSHEYFVNFNPAGFPAGTIQVQYQPGPVGGIAQPIQQVINIFDSCGREFRGAGGIPCQRAGRIWCRRQRH